MCSTHSVIVIGAGISGLACAYALKKRGADVLVLEASDSPGGVIHSVEEKGYLFETGPQSFSTTAQLTALIGDLGLADEFVVAPPKAPRYILVNSELRSLPLGPGAFLASSLLEWSTKFSILREPFSRSSPPADDESVAAFTRRKFKPELLELLVGPFVSGIYAGDPEKISIRAAFPSIYEAERAAGSIVRGMRTLSKKRKGPRIKPALASFRRGNQTIIQSLVQKLGDSIRPGVRVTQICRAPSNHFRLYVETSAGSTQFEALNLVIAAPAFVVASLLQTLAPTACEALSQIEYAPVAVASLGYRRADVAHSLNGFGFLVPRSAGLKILGTVWNSSLFPDRAPSDSVQLTSFLGGATDPDTASLSDSSLVVIAHRELTPILGLRTQPVASRITKYERAIPQYNLGHMQHLAAIAAAIAKISGLHLTGNYLRGPAIGTCVEHAQSVAESIRIG